MNSPGSNATSSLSFRSVEGLLSRWFRGARHPDSPKPTPRRLWSEYGEGARGFEPPEIIPELELEPEPVLIPQKRSRLERLWKFLNKRGTSKGCFHGGEKYAETLAGGGTLIRLITFPIHHETDYSLWLDQSLLAQQTLVPANSDQRIKYRNALVSFLADGVWFARFKADSANQPWCLIFHPRHWKGHGTRNGDPANTTFPALHGFRPAATGVLDKLRSIGTRWPLKPEISHSCHFPICGSPRCLHCEPQYVNTRRNYCEPIADGTCKCGASRPCTRIYRSTWKTDDLEILEDKSEIEAQLTRQFGQKGYSWVYVKESEILTEHAKRENDRKKRGLSRKADQEAGKENDRTEARKEAAKKTRKLDNVNAAKEKEAHARPLP